MEITKYVGLWSGEITCFALGSCVSLRELAQSTLFGTYGKSSFRYVPQRVCARGLFCSNQIAALSPPGLQKGLPPHWIGRYPST